MDLTFLFFPLSLTHSVVSLTLATGPFVCLGVCLCIYPCASNSLYLSLSSSLYLSLSLFISLYLSLSSHFSVHLNNLILSNGDN